MIDPTKTALLKKLEYRVAEKYTDALNRIDSLKRIYNTEKEQIQLSGQIEAYETVCMMIQELLH